jgi:hypothetical protein
MLASCLLFLCACAAWSAAAAPDACADDPCGLHGTCTDVNGAFECDCDIGWLPPTCTQGKVRVVHAYISSQLWEESQMY